MPHGEVSVQRTGHRDEMDAQAKKLAIASAAAKPVPIQEEQDMDENTRNEKVLAMQGKSSDDGVTPGAFAVKPTSRQYPNTPGQSFTSSLDNMSEEDMKPPATDGNFPATTPIAAEVVDQDMDRDVSHDKILCV
jgi:hypothetical protein